MPVSYDIMSFGVYHNTHPLKLRKVSSSLPQVTEAVVTDLELEPRHAQVGEVWLGPALR